MKKLLIILLLSALKISLLWGQAADPAVTGAFFTPTAIGVGQSTTLTISFANTGSTVIPAGSIEMTISTANTYYKSNGTTAPAGTGGAMFTWTYVGSDVWKGTNTASIAAFGGGNVTLQVTGITQSTSSEITNVNVQPISSFASFNDSPNNNNVQPKLKINAAVVGNADLKITKNLLGTSKIKAINDVVSYMVVVKNLGPNAATNVVVKDSTTAGLQLINGTTTNGTYLNPLWNIPSIASGDSAVLTVTAKIIAEGLSYNWALIKQSDQTDGNSINNSSYTCVSVPFQICGGQGVDVNVPSNLTGVVWKDAQGNIVPSNNGKVTLTAAGVYTFTATNGTCPTGGCCPVVVQNSQNCCPIQICIPLTAVKRKL